MLHTTLEQAIPSAWPLKVRKALKTKGILVPLPPPPNYWEGRWNYASPFRGPAIRPVKWSECQLLVCIWGVIDISVQLSFVVSLTSHAVDWAAHYCNQGLWFQDNSIAVQFSIAIVANKVQNLISLSSILIIPNGGERFKNLERIHKRCFGAWIAICVWQNVTCHKTVRHIRLLADQSWSLSNRK